MLEREPLGGGRKLDVRLFGQADIRYCGAPVKFAKRATTLTMLALLVLKRGSAVARDSLAFTLFPESDEASALAELRRYLYLASKALPPRDGEPWIVSDAETVRWNGAGDAFVDVLEFEGLAGEDETRQQAVDLYAGDLLENVYEDWVVAERDRLRALYLSALGDLIVRSRAQRNYPLAIASAKRILIGDPWREDTLRILMALRYESGDTAGALSEYDRFAKRLRDELGVTPMPETAAVRQSILRQEAVPGTIDPRSPKGEQTPRRAVAILPFVGRKKELQVLYDAWSRAARGSAGLVVVSGEAGVGKTRLAAELARIVQSEGGRVFVGTTSSPESIPYQGLIEALRSGLPLLLARNVSAERRTVLAPLLPELRDPDVPQTIFMEISPERATARIYEALSFAVRALASPRPLLLILEDLHWAGSATIQALGSILRDATRSPILIVATCRQEETPVAHPLRALERSLGLGFNVEDLELERLDEEDVGELVTSVEGLGGSDDLVRALYARSEGNPLFLDEAITAVLENRDESRESATISNVIGRRIARLGREGRAVAEIASVAGSGCSVPLIRDVSNLSSTVIARGLDELLDRRILREAGARASYDYVFSHHLIADAVYAGIEPAFRRQRHHRVADCMRAMFESSGSGSPREIARHYEAAQAHASAAEFYLLAASAAAGVHAPGDAIDLAGRALANAPSDDLRRAALKVREAARGHSGDRQGQLEDIEALEKLASGDRHAQFDVLLRRIFLARTLGDSNDEKRYIERLEQLAAELGESERAQALTQAATHLTLCSRSAEAVEPARRALTIYEQSGDVSGQLECLSLLVESTANTGDLEAEQEYLIAIRERSASVGDRAVEARALRIAAIAALLRQEYKECFLLTQRLLQLSIEMNDREGEAAARGRLAVTAAWLGDYTFALREFDATTKTYESLGHKRGLAVTYTNRTMLLMRVGLFSEALRSIELSNELFERVQEKRTVVVNQVNASFVNLQLGEAAKAKALASSALTIARELGYPVFEAAALSNLGNAERFAGELQAAIEHMEAGIAVRRSVQAARDFVDDLADLTLAYAEAGRNEGALEIARELEALGAASFEGAFWPHYAWWAIAQGLAAGGAQTEARKALARARSELAAFAHRIADRPTRDAFLAVRVNQAIDRATD